MSRILITGGAGFIGSHLAERLVLQGHTVDVVDPKIDGRFFGRTHLHDTCQEFIADTPWPFDGKWDFVYHLAATVGVKRVLENPAACIENNIESLRAVLSLGIPGLFTSTSEVYGRTDTILREDSPLVYSAKSRWCYAASKLIGEWMCQQTKGWKAVRLFNVVGPRQSTDYGAVLPKFVSQAIRNEPITVYGDGTQVRTFIDVRDCVEILDKLRDKTFDVVNVGGTRCCNMRDLAEQVRDVLKSKSEIKMVPYDQAYPAGFEECALRMPCLEKLNALVPERRFRNFYNTITDLAEALHGTVCQ